MSSTTENKSIHQEADKPSPYLTFQLRDWWLSHSIRDELAKFKDQFVDKEWVRLYTSNEVKGTIINATALVIASVGVAVGVMGIWMRYQLRRSVHQLEKAILKANGHRKAGNGTSQQKNNNGHSPSNETAPKNDKYEGGQ